jgi:hypothetical protein
VQRVAGIALPSALLLALGACENLNWPFHHAHSDSSASGTAAEGGTDPDECADILTQIRQNREARREAITTSTNPDIVSAAQGKADKRIDDLQRRYEELDCPAANADADRPGREPPLQPAPGAINR